MTDGSTGDHPTARTTRSRGEWFVWIIPALALLAAGSYIIKDVLDAGRTITIQVGDGSGMSTGQTTLQYRGVKVGVVKQIEFAPDRHHVNLKVKVSKDNEWLAVEGSRFWVVRPSISLKGVKDLGGITSGPYIAVMPGSDDSTAKDEFTAESSPPPTPDSPDEFIFFIRSGSPGSLSQDSPIYFREIQVGQVLDVRMASDARSVLLRCSVQKKYAPLLKLDTKFWNASGIGVDLGLFGAKISTESLATILSGGIAFATPPNAGPNIEQHAVYRLFDKPEDSWLKWDPKIDLPELPVPSWPLPPENQVIGPGGGMTEFKP
ncbi:MAG: hypothetical protein CMJ32_09385 [Phycisphaerae bacterium]|nr:hypothetical protein [Phycisphaerae bacterium]